MSVIAEADQEEPPKEEQKEPVAVDSHLRTPLASGQIEMLVLREEVVALALAARSKHMRQGGALGLRVPLWLHLLREASTCGGAPMRSQTVSREEHNCDFDHKSAAREILAKNNPNISIKGGAPAV